MRRLLPCLVMLMTPALAQADKFPYTNKGPAITGVGQNDAWVTWYTAHHQGKASFANSCQTDALTGTPNDTIPTLTLQIPNAGKATFEDQTCSRYHKVHLTALQPDTLYTFELDKTYEGGASAVGSFRTAPASTVGTFQFVVYGDTRDVEITATSTRAEHQALIDAMVAGVPPSIPMINVGDFALNYPLVSGDDRGYTGFFEVERPLLANHPVWVAYGNHESIDTTFFDGLLNAPSFVSAAHPYYSSLDWGPIHFTILNSFEGPADITKGGAHKPELSDVQAQWADSDLAAAKARGQKLFIVSHQSPFSYGTGPDFHGGGPDVLAKIVPLMIKHGVLGLFAGHDHYYQRGREGCVGYYVVGAGGAPMYDPDPTAAGVLRTEKKVSYMVVTVTASGATGEVFDSTGASFDSFSFEAAGCDGADAGMPADAATAGADAAALPGEDASTSAPDAELQTAQDASSTGPDAGATALDASGTTGDASVASGADAAAVVPPDAGSTAGVQTGCSCSAGGPVLSLAMGLLAMGLLRRRRG